MEQREGLVDGSGASIRVGDQHRRERACERRWRALRQRTRHVDAEAHVRQLLGVDAGEHRHGGRAEAVDVGARRRAALELLGRHEAERADDGATAGGLQPIPDRAEVDQRERAVGPAKDVARLDVAMNDGRRAPVEVTKGLADVLEHARDVHGAHGASVLLDRGQALSFDLLHHEIERAVLLEVFEVARQPRMIERRERARLALRELDVLPRLRAADAEALDRDEPRVLRDLAPALLLADVAAPLVGERRRARGPLARFRTDAVIHRLVGLPLRALAELAKERVSTAAKDLGLFRLGRRRRRGHPRSIARREPPLNAHPPECNIHGPGRCSMRAAFVVVASLFSLVASTATPAHAQSLRPQPSTCVLVQLAQKTARASNGKSRRPVKGRRRSPA